MSAPATIRAAAAALRGGAPARAARTIRLPAGELRLRANQRELLEAIAGYYAPYEDKAAAGPAVDAMMVERPAGPRAPGRRREGEGPARLQGPKEAMRRFPDGMLVRKNRSGLLYTAGSRVMIAGRCRSNLNQVVNALNDRLIEARQRQGWLLAHAACVVRGGRALAITGPSGAGKTTLALELLRCGWQLVTNDRLLIRTTSAGLRALGVPKRPRANPGTIVHNPSLWPAMPSAQRRAHAARPSSALWGLEEKHDIDVGACFGPERIRGDAPLAAVLFLGWGERDAPNARPARVASRPDLVRMIAKALPGASSPALAPYADALRPLPAYELTGVVDFATGVEAAHALLGASKEQAEASPATPHPQADSPLASPEDG